MVISIKKNGNMIELYCEEHETPVKFDCKKRQIISFTGRTVKNLPNCVRKAAEGKDRNFLRILDFIVDGIRYDTTLTTIEPFLPYIDILDSDFPCECPKGYINYVLENNLRINCNTLFDFYEYIFLKNFSEKDREFMKWFEENINLYGFSFTNYSKEEALVLIKIIKKSIKKFYFNFKETFKQFVNLIKEISDWAKAVNTERDVEFNYIELKEKLERVKTEAIKKQQLKISELNNQIIDDYIIKVPLSVEELQEEGKMQDNCVGHYYNNSIIEGRNLIYFIRKKEMPNKSYITCRFNIAVNSTVESRYRFNNCVEYDSKDDIFIKSITNKIIEILERGE